MMMKSGAMTARAHVTRTPVTAALFHLRHWAYPGLGREGETSMGSGGLRGNTPRHALQHDLRGDIDQDRDGEKHKAQLEQGAQVKVRGRLRELVGDHACKRVARREERCADLGAVADHHRYRHRLSQGAAEAQDRCAEEPPARIAEHRYPEDLPPRRAKRVGRLALEIRDGAQNLARYRRDDRQDHDRYDDARREHADPRYEEHTCALP